ncbi:MAG: HAD-superfamily phosphatase subfamily IIIC/FkbH domain-containing [Desulfovibrionaceae bacterium]|nr:MAG: HAD-superfamily phosphatase subfamily IIIC/FkbH domain-containing [Desulfovibrionaceae bacterium]
MTEAFGRIVEVVFERNPLQRKNLEPFLNDAPPVYWERAEDFARSITALLHSKGLGVEYLADAYMKLCADMLKEQMRFQRTGAYSLANAAQAYEKVYSLPERMAPYMYGLALSQFLWPNHYAMFDFFLAQSAGLAGVESVLEVGPGHGLYLAQAARLFPSASLEALDISPASLEIAKEASDYFSGPGRCTFRLGNVENLEKGTFSYVIMGEVLEHLDDPDAALRGIRAALKPGGRLFLTTCANCPAIDHVHLFESVAHIREELLNSGFAIVKDIALTSGGLPAEDGMRAEINYAGILEPAA